MHLVQTMAYTGDAPWHGLGHRLTPNQALEVWARQAGMDWSIEAADIQYSDGHSFPNSLHKFPGQKVLYRSDTKAPLSVVSNRFKVVQPAEILEFYRDLTEVGGYDLETAGVLKNGKKIWALARTNHNVTLRDGDTVNGYLLLATACDGTLATTAQFTSVRVVCNNTLAIALGNSTGAVRVPHRCAFDAYAVKQQLGIAVASWSIFEDYIKELANCKVAEKIIDGFLAKVLSYPTGGEQQSVVVNELAIKKTRMLYSGQGKGAELSAAKGTAWGLLNSVTEYVDHHRRAHSNEYRKDSAWFGHGATIKQRAWKEALKLIA